MIADGRAAVWLALALACSCRPSSPVDTAAALVDVSRNPAGPDYEPVGTVDCAANERGRPRADNDAACEAELRTKARQLDADLVVIETESPASPPCPTCVVLQGKALRRKLPWEQAARRPSTFTGEAAEKKPAEVWTGTGFVVAPDGTILTAHHVVDGARTLSVSFPDGRHGAASVTRRLASSDLALLHATTKTAAYLSLADSKTVEVGQRVWTLGYPVVDLLGIEPKFADGAVSALSGLGEAAAFQVTVPVQPGNSGGPLLTEDGFVVGVVTSTAAALPFLRATGALPQGISWAMKSDPVRPLFTEPPPGTKAASRSDAVAHATASLCLIEAVHGDGLVVAPRGFGEGLTPKTLTVEAYDGLRRRCDDGNQESCLSVALTVVAECNGEQTGPCRASRFGRTMLSHACGVGHHAACDVLTKHGEG